MKKSGRTILFVAGCLFTKSSGPYLSLKQTAEMLEARGHTVEIVGTRQKHAPEIPRDWNFPVRAFRRYGPDSMHFAPGVRKWLTKSSNTWEIASLQGVWMHINQVAAEACIRARKPFMITAHGNFNPQALSISAWKKALARHTFMCKAFEHVTCYQALSEIEYEYLREFGIRKPICVIANGIRIPENTDYCDPVEHLQKKLLNRRTCLYLGRLHPIKGVDRLLRAWAKANPSEEWQLVIAGSGEAHYRITLEKLSASLGCRDVHFVGFATGPVKDAWLRQAEFLVLPSTSEGLAMTPLEGFSFGTPALVTRACGFPEAERFGAAMEVATTDEGVIEGLVRMLALSEEKRRIMSGRALELVSKHYSWEKICMELEQVYDWLCGDGALPSSVRLD